jgi:hypothetical protein
VVKMICDNWVLLGGAGGVSTPNLKLATGGQNQ